MTPDPQEQAPDLDEIQEYCNAATEAEQWPQLIISYALVDLPALVKYTRSLQARLAEAERDNRCYCAVCRTAELLKDPPVDSTLP